MDTKTNETDMLYETIRKELNSIIGDSNSKVDNEAEKDNSKPKQTTKRSFDQQAASNINVSKASVKEDVDISKINIAKPANFLENETTHDIDTDIRRMQANLRQSYELFQTVGDKFETINFTGLKNRIKDLHLSTNQTNSQQRIAINTELQGMFDKNYVENSIDKLTTEMSDKFRKHPGEFGDIPEISAFFKACSQLEHGLDELKRQRNDIHELGKRVDLATNISNDRIVEIKHTMDERESNENVN